MTDALAALEAREAALTVEVDAVREAIAAIRKIPGAPPAAVATPTSTARRAKASPTLSPTPRPERSDGDLPPEVQRALEHGPMLVSDFLKKTKLSRYLAQQLVKRGVLVATGGTVNRRYGLPGSPARQEEP